MRDEREEEHKDDAPTFIDLDSAVEVDVAEDGEPMDEEATGDDDVGGGGDAMTSDATAASSSPDNAKASFDAHGDAVYAIACNYDEGGNVLRVVSGGGDERAFLHLVGDSATESVALSHPHTDSISCVAFNAPFVHSDVSGTPQQSYIAVGAYDGAVVLYDAASEVTARHRSPAKVLEGPSDVEWLCFHPKGGTVLMAGSIADGTIWMYHLPTSKVLQVFVGHENGGVTAGSFSSDGKSALSCGQDGTFRIWAPKSGKCKCVLKLTRLVGSSDEEPPPGLTCMAVGGGSDKELVLVGGENGKAYVVHVGSKKLVTTLHHYEQIQSSSPMDIGTGNNAGGGRADDEDEEEGHAISVEAVGFCPSDVIATSNWCATGGVDGILKVWNLNAGGAGGAQLRQRCQRHDADGGGNAGITRLQWHSTHPLIMASYTDGTVQVWDARTGSIVQSFFGHEDMVNDMSVCFLRNGSTTPSKTMALIATGSDDKSVRVFEYSVST